MRHRTQPPRAPVTAPTRQLEGELLSAGYRSVAGMDEVGRGALAGPVSVGLVVVDVATAAHPEGLRDSKLLRPEARQALVDPVRGWGGSQAVGHASAAEIDEVGLTPALRLAGLRALRAVASQGAMPDDIILDGHHDWLSAPSLFDDPAQPEPPEVRTVIKADLTCAAVAAASVLAKCERDAVMVDLATVHPHFAWEANKGYAAPAHISGLRVHGPSEEHRRSWRLPGAADQRHETADLAASSAVSGQGRGKMAP